MRRIRRLPPIAAVFVLLAGCRHEMYDQPRYEPQEASDFFADGKADRPLLPGVVPRLDPKDQPRDEQYDRIQVGVVDGKPVEEVPFKVDRAVLERGRQRFEIYCSPCHGYTGDGHGMIVQRGFTAPPSLYGKRHPAGKSAAATFYEDLRDAPAGHFFEVITNGHGAMYSYASRVAPRDRWAVAAYIRALQLSRYAKVDELPPDVREKLPRENP
ncbi:MAG TPA: cytochrome c [Isosphaeraceae bacterium]